MVDCGLHLGAQPAMVDRFFREDCPPASLATTFILFGCHGWLVHPCSNLPRFRACHVRIGRPLRVISKRSRLYTDVDDDACATYVHQRHTGGQATRATQNGSRMGIRLAPDY
jgi:hypothetical protein